MQGTRQGLHDAVCSVEQDRVGSERLRRHAHNIVQGELSWRDRLDTLPGLRDRMQATGLLTAARQTHIDSIGGQGSAKRIASG